MDVAAVPDVLLSSEKDRYYVRYACHMFQELFECVYGDVQIESLRPEIKAIAAATYLSTTTAKGRQTLGAYILIHRSD